MILQELYHLAERQGLLDELDIEPAKVDVVVEITSQGDFAGVFHNVMQTKVPRRSERTSGVLPHFLADKSQYALGVCDSSKSSAKRVQRAKKCHASFAELVGQAAKEVDVTEAKALVAFLTKPGEVARAVGEPASEDGWTAGEWVAFRLAGSDSFVHENEALRAWWAKTRALPQAEATKAICLVTGHADTVARTHPSVRAPGFGQASGVSLVSFNQRAMLSWGFSQCENAPVSRRAAEAYGDALQWLLATEQKTVEQKSGKTKTVRVFKRAVRLDDNILCIWSSEPRAGSHPALTLVKDGATPQQAKEQIEHAVWSGQPATTSTERLLGLLLGANGGRLIVREWLSLPLTEASQHLQAYFDDLDIAGSNPDRPPSLGRLRAAASNESKDGLPSYFQEALVRAALLSGPTGPRLLSHLVRRLHLIGEDDGWKFTFLTGLIKLTLRRSPYNQEVQMALDETNTQRAYLLGRLFSLLEQAQVDSAGRGLNVTIRDRFFSSAATTPASAFPRLMRGSVHHLSKLQKDKPGWAVTLDKKIDQIVSNLPAEGPFPTVLSLEDQGLFAVGYHHQRQARFTKKGEAQGVAGEDQ